MNGRELATYSDGTNNISYKYNLDGIRTSKTVNNVTTNYYLEGNRIVFEDRNGTVLYYIYDSDELLGLVYNNNIYYYHKNMLGDIIGIYDSNYNEIVTYEYDSWGGIKNINDNSNINLGTINPFRYRSYYYDEETQLYYLNSRYYSPLIGRFVNLDSFNSTGKGSNGNNMFCYTENNFVNYKDGFGFFSIKGPMKNINRIGKNRARSSLDVSGDIFDSTISEINNLFDEVSSFMSNALKIGKKFMNKIANSFVFEWGTGIGADIGLNGTEYGIANTFGQTYYQGEWHDYDRVKGAVTVGISDRIALGASREYTLYSNSVSYNKCVSNPFCIMNSNNSQIDNYFFFKDRKTNAVIEGNFVGLSVDFYLIVGFDLKIGFMIE